RVSRGRARQSERASFESVSRERSVFEGQRLLVGASCMATGGEQPSFAGWRNGCGGKSSTRSGLCTVRVGVSEVLRIYASFDDQFHRSINRLTYDVIGRFRLTFGQKAHLAAAARVPCTDGGSDGRKTKITALTRPESGHDLFQPCRRHQLPRAQYVACRRVPRSHKS